MNIDGFIRSSKSFSEFFEKAATTTNKERGDLFERVAQLHLKSKPKYASELDEVWQLDEVPKDVRKHLKLPDGDQGIDLIAKLNWRPFEEARQWASSLPLSSKTDWNAYVKGEMEHLPSLPIDIPKAPWAAYPQWKTGA